MSGVSVVVNGRPRNVEAAEWGSVSVDRLKVAMKKAMGIRATNSVCSLDCLR